MSGDDNIGRQAQDSFMPRGENFKLILWNAALPMYGRKSFTTFRKLNLNQIATSAARQPHVPINHKSQDKNIITEIFDSFCGEHRL